MKITVTWKDIWNKTHSKEFDSLEDAKEWIQKRHLRDDIKQESWKIAE